MGYIHKTHIHIMYEHTYIYVIDYTVALIFTIMGLKQKKTTKQMALFHGCCWYDALSCINKYTNSCSISIIDKLSCYKSPGLREFKEKKK